MKTLIKNAVILTQNNVRKIIPRGCVLIEGTKISEVSPYSISGTFDCEIDAQGMWIVPGFINSHVHLGESIYAPFMPKKYSLAKYLQRTEELASSSKDVENSRETIAQYSLLHSLKSGTTTVGGGRVFEASEKLGLRNVSGYMLMQSDKLGHFNKNFEEKFELILQAKSSGLSSHALFVHSLNTVDERMLSAASNIFSKNDNFLLMIHVAEDTDSIENIKNNWGRNELSILEDFDLLNTRTLIIHGNHFKREDLEKLQSKGSSIIHCLSSNMNVADGTLDLRTALEMNINIALATDGVVTAFDFSVLREATHAYRYHNRFKQEDIISAQTFFDMITIKAAQALGLVEKIGSIEIGKEADLLIIRPPFEESCLNPIERLLMYGNLIKIQDVFIGGKHLVQNRIVKNKITGEIEDNFRKVVMAMKRKLNI